MRSASRNCPARRINCSFSVGSFHSEIVWPVQASGPLGCVTPYSWIGWSEALAGVGSDMWRYIPLPIGCGLRRSLSRNAASPPLSLENREKTVRGLGFPYGVASVASGVSERTASIGHSMVGHRTSTNEHSITVDQPKIDFCSSSNQQERSNLNDGCFEVEC